MQVGMIGLGRMGANMVRRFMRGGHVCVAHDVSADAVRALESEGATPALTLDALVAQLTQPRVVWLMVPAAVVAKTLDVLLPKLSAGDIVVDGGNSYYRDDVDRAKQLATLGMHHVDCGTSGGVFGLERGYCLMIGGEPDIVHHLDPLFATLAPGAGAVARTPGRETMDGTSELGYLHCGPNGAGHFVKMVHNGIEYGMMAAFSEGLNILKNANIGKREHTADAETSPLRNPEYYQYDLHLPVPVQKPVIIHILQEIRRIIEVAVVVVIPIQELMKVEGPTHADALRHRIRVLQGKIQCLVSAEAASR